MSSNTLKPQSVVKSKGSSKKYSPKPEWLKVKAPSSESYVKIREMISGLKLATVCQEARCPNLGECWDGGTATFMILGEYCTRGCRFCHVKTSKEGTPLDLDEPKNVADAVSTMGLNYVVLTSVDRDDLADFGSQHFADTVTAIKALETEVVVEVLTPDFDGVESNIDRIIASRPEVIAQNLETVESLTRRVRDRRAGYKKTLDFLSYVKHTDESRYTKTSLMLGLGEKDNEVRQALFDLRDVGCDVVTFGQYLQPSAKQLKVEEFVRPEKFEWWKNEALAMGFLYVASGPLVRSSYKAGEHFMANMIKQGAK